MEANYENSKVHPKPLSKIPQKAKFGLLRMTTFH